MKGRKGKEQKGRIISADSILDVLLLVVVFDGKIVVLNEDDGRTNGGFRHEKHTTKCWKILPREMVNVFDGL